MSPPGGAYGAPDPVLHWATALPWDVRADVAQLVEHFTRNEGVRGSNPRVGFPTPTSVGV